MTDRYATPDPDRRRRTGVGEIVFAEGKSVDQTLALLARLRRDDPEVPALATRCPPEVLVRAAAELLGEEVAVDRAARTVCVGTCPPARGDVAVVSAGTSDLPVAAECRATLAALGVGTREVVDVGVAGLHRLLDRLDVLAGADVVIVVAGMDGVLPGTVRGLVRAPTIGVPTSVGYGVAAGGRTALDTMLASCSPGLVVVNIDNGVGAAVHAAAIVRAVRP